jgi:hypothetical protein
MAGSGLSPARLSRARDVLSRHVDEGYCPGAVGVIARRGEVHIDATGTLAFDGVGADTPMAADTICRLASTSKPLVAACALTLVEDGTLRLDDPVDELLPELADMTVLADPDGPLQDTVAAKRSITLRDLLSFRLGTGMVLTDVPIARALAAVNDGPPPNDCHEGGPDRVSGRVLPAPQTRRCLSSPLRDARRTSCSISVSIGVPAGRRGARSMTAATFRRAWSPPSRAACPSSR